MLSPEEELCKAMARVLSGFQRNELALLAVTSKVEHVLRDRLAYELFRSLNKDGLAVVREHRRVDVAVLHETSPIFAVQLKQMYTFDPLRKENAEYYKLQIKRDIEKCDSLVDQYPQLFILLICVDLSGPLPPWAKYRHQIRGAFERHGKAVGTKACVAVKRWRLMKHAKHSRADAGTAYGVTVRLDYWIAEFPPPPKLTKRDMAAIKIAEAQIERGEYYTLDEVVKQLEDRFSIRFRSRKFRQVHNS
jgi:hypothetical protein